MQYSFLFWPNTVVGHRCRRRRRRRRLPPDAVHGAEPNVQNNDKKLPVRFNGFLHTHKKETLRRIFN